MAIQFDLFENPGKEGFEGPRLHAKVITKNMVTTRDMCESISRKCTVTPADVSGVLAALEDEMFQALRNGYSVHIDELGFFTLSLKCASDVNPKHVSSSDIAVRTINFTPDKDFADKFKTVEFKRCTSHGHHSTKLDDKEVNELLQSFFEKHHFMTRREFEKLTGFNQVKSLRYIHRLIEDGVICNAGTRYHPIYVKSEGVLD